MQNRFIFERGAALGRLRRLRFRWSAGHRHVTGTRSKPKCRFEASKVALRRHLGGTTRPPHDLVIDAEKIHFWERVAPVIWRWRWHWRWCCRPQQRSERGPGEARAQLCELHGRSRPPDCCPGWPWPTQIAQRSRCPSPQPKATSQGSTAQPGRDGPGAVWGGVSVARGV